MALKLSTAVLILGVCMLWRVVSSIRYLPNWDSLDTRPIPSWYDDVKIGMVIHWGVFSVPSTYYGEWFWYAWQTSKAKECVQFMNNNYKPDFTYADFAPELTADFFDPNQWADLFKAAGVGYTVFVAKHHEGFCNWPSKYSFNWNAMDVGPKRDLVGDLAAAIRARTNIRFGIYHSLFEWYNPLYLQDKMNNYTTQKFVESKVMPEMYEVVNKYKPEYLFSDGDWEANDTYWNSTQFIAWLYNDSPVKDTVVTNDRWGKNSRCIHGGVYACDNQMNPGHLIKRKWENAMTIDKQWAGFRRNAPLSDYLTIEELLALLIETVSCGGNILINVAITHDGLIVPIFEERLRQMGAWLDVNGESIYSTRPWSNQNDTLTTGVWYTSKKQESGLSVYAIIQNWPTGQTLTFGAPITTSKTTVSLLGYPNKFNWVPASPSGGIVIEMPYIPISRMPCQWAWVFKLQNLAN
ncbi:hypothetical protein ACJMK2_035368 [Sinanodonta woodiana]|uniref:alpha-L-fucosidase n=1 Tax=Sinanodonta woodiana TaxID=1069815 RepID=A0ABD3WY68_SINWO